MVSKKFPLLELSLLDFLASKPSITGKLSSRDFSLAKKVLLSEDTPILAGTLKAKADVLVTLDKRFLNAVQGKTALDVQMPGEFLEQWRKEHEA